MTRWEHKVIHMVEPGTGLVMMVADRVALLDREARDGWEAFAVEYDKAYFKRALEGPAP